MNITGKWSTVLVENGCNGYPLQGNSNDVLEYCKKHRYRIICVLYDGPDFHKSITLWIDHRGTQLV